MFIHIGNDHILRSRNIISIIDCQTIDSSKTMEEMIHSMDEKGKIKGSSTDAKSVIITKDSIYYSSLSVSTLTKRSSIRQMVKKVKNHSE